jgi:hypothetical protein
MNQNITCLSNRLMFVASCLFALLGCRSNGKGEFLNTTKVCDNLYVEAYRTFGSGASGGDLIAEYLTDSSAFRYYIGEFDDATGGLTYKCAGDTLTIIRTSSANTGKRYKIVQCRTYSIILLKNTKNMSGDIMEKNDSDQNLSKVCPTM